MRLNKLKNNKSGFTLLEIIIVIIIVGVLASLALPRLFSQVEFSRSAEALNAAGHLKRAVDRCVMMIEASTGTPGDETECGSLALIGAEDPGNTPGAHFDYIISSPAADQVLITATRNAVEYNGSNPDSTITLTMTLSTGNVLKAGTLDFAGIH